MNGSTTIIKVNGPQEPNNLKSPKCRGGELPPRRLRFPTSPPLFLALILCALCAPRVEAKITIDAGVGFGGTFVSGAWTPLRLLLDNSPDPQRPEERIKDFAGTLSVRIVANDGTVSEYVRQIELPRNSRKLVEMTVILASRGQDVEVSLVDTRGSTVMRTSFSPMAGARGGVGLDLRLETHITPTVLLVIDGQDTASFPSAISPRANIRTVGPQALPADHKGYDAVRLVVVRSKLAGRLSEAQLGALRTWIGLGGRLVVVIPRNQAAIRTDAWLIDLLPAEIEGVAEMRLGELVSGSGDELTLVTLWGERRVAARTLWASPAGDLALAISVGAGEVIALGIDPTSLNDAGLKSPLGQRLRMLLEAILMAPVREDLRARHYWSAAQIDPKFSGILLLPNIWVVTGLLMLFVVVVGPLNFYLLRKRRRLELAWATIPALSVVFFLAVYAYGVVSKGGDQHYARAEILHLGEGSSEGLLLSYGVQFSPRRSVYEFDAGEAGSVIPTASYYDNPTDFRPTFAQAFGPGWNQGPGALQKAASGDAARLEVTGELGHRLAYPAEQWKMNFYLGEEPMRIEGEIEGRVVMQAGGKSFRVEIRNQTEADLGDARLYLGMREYRLGDLASGAEFDHEFVVSGKQGFEPGPSAFTAEDTEFARQASDALRDGALDRYPILMQQNPQRRCRLVARQNKWRSEVKIDPAPDFDEFVGLVEVELPVELEGEVSLTTLKLLRREVYAFEPRGTTFFQGQTDLCTLNDSWVEIVIAAPKAAARMEFVSGAVKVPHTPHTNVLTVYAYDYTSGRWEEAMSGPDPNLTSNRNVKPPLVEFEIKPNWVNPFGPFVRLRLSAKTFAPPNTASNTAANRQVIRGNVPWGGYGVGIQNVICEMTLMPRGGVRIARAVLAEKAETEAATEVASEAEPIEELPDAGGAVIR